MDIAAAFSDVLSVSWPALSSFAQPMHSFFPQLHLRRPLHAGSKNISMMTAAIQKNWSVGWRSLKDIITPKTAIQ